MLFCFFFFKDTATTEIYTYWHTLSLHDALPILTGPARAKGWTLGRMLARSTMRSQIILICDRMSYVRETGGIVSMVQSRKGTSAARVGSALLVSTCLTAFAPGVRAQQEPDDAPVRLDPTVVTATRRDRKSVGWGKRGAV